MMTISIQDAQAKLPELIHGLTAGEEVVIVENNQPVAKLVGGKPASRMPRQRGSAKGKLTIHSDDEDHLDDFKEYMP